MNTDQRYKELTHDRLGADMDDVINPYDIQRRLEVLIDEFLQDVDLTDMLALDAGCGTGPGAQHLTHSNAQVIAVDLGENLVRHTRDAVGCPTGVGSIMQLPFPNNTFDVVFSTEVIEHTPDPVKATQELYRVLKPGGHLVLSTPGWLWQGPVRIASALQLRPYAGLENFLTSKQLRSALEDVGGTILEHRGIHLVPFQIAFANPFNRYMDRYGKQLLPLMINQCIHCYKPHQ